MLTEKQMTKLAERLPDVAKFETVYPPVVGTLNWVYRLNPKEVIAYQRGIFWQLTRAGVALCIEALRLCADPCIGYWQIEDVTDDRVLGVGDTLAEAVEAAVKEVV